MSHLPTSRGRAQLVRRAEVAETMADVLHTDLQTLVSETAVESTARLELALEDVGWQRLVARLQTEFSRSGLERMATLSRLMWRKNPLIRRAVNVRTYYVWAQGVSVQARDDDVNDLIQTTINDRVNQAAVFGHDACERLDRTLATDGQIVIVAHTSQATGAVQVRTLPWTEIVDPVRNPEDRTDIWFWRRRWHDTAGVHEQLHPDIDHQPTGIRPSQVNGFRVRWDQPIMHVAVDKLDGETWGVPEVYAALDWARAYKEFLEDWASYVRALAEFAWKHKTKSGAAAKRAKTTHTTARTDQTTGERRPAGSTAIGTDVDGLEPIKHQGAHVDADSGRPLAMMVAAAMDMPYSILTGDADNSNLATAKTLDRPFELALISRQKMWSAVWRRLFDYIIDAAVRAPRGPLTGTVERDEWGHARVSLPDETDRTVDVDWPSLVEHDLKDLVESIKFATEALPEMPPDVTLRLLLTAFGVEDVDEHVQAMQDAAARQETVAQAEEAAGSILASVLERELQEAA